MRLDKFLQVSRLVKRRTVAGALCDKGRVRVNGDSRLIAKVLSVPERAAPSKEYAEILTRVAVHSLADR
jgi:ribosomal 50S subunit-recycling heat shock protein